MTPLERIIYPFRRPDPPEPRAAMGFFTDTTLCIGCKACEVACKQWNQLPADGLEWSGTYDNTQTLSASTWRHVAFVEQFDPQGNVNPLSPAPPGPGEGTERFDLAALLVEPKAGRWLMMSDVCKHCSAAPCQLACPTGAIVHDEFSDVYIQNDICNGCGYCVAACPFGVITRGNADGHAHKCTLCYDRQRDGMVPACAKACPTGSIQFGPLDELRACASDRVARLHERGEAGAYLYGAEASATYSAMHAFFLLLDRPQLYGLPDAPYLPQLNLRGDFARAIAAAIVSAVFAALAILVSG